MRVPWVRSAHAASAWYGAHPELGIIEHCCQVFHGSQAIPPASNGRNYNEVLLSGARSCHDPWPWHGPGGDALAAEFPDSADASSELLQLAGGRRRLTCGWRQDAEDPVWPSAQAGPGGSGGGSVSVSAQPAQRAQSDCAATEAQAH